MSVWYRIAWYCLQPLVRSFFRFTVYGNENIPADGPLVIASNHCSNLDPPLVALGITRQITFLAKEELFRVPLLGALIRSFDAYPVSRGQGDVKAIRVALRMMKENKALLIFPEGTRSMDGRMQELESGAAWISLKSGAPVLPVFLSGTHAAFPRKSWFPRPYRVCLRIGKPIDPKQVEKNIADGDRVRYFTGIIKESMQILMRISMESVKKEAVEADG